MNGKGYTKPDLSLSHSENFIYMLKGEKPTPDEVKPIEMMFILQAEHSTNASTFATMVAGSTLADLYSAATAGISALKGPLHGGADEEALKMMEAIGDPSNTESYINDALAAKSGVNRSTFIPTLTYTGPAKKINIWPNSMGLAKFVNH